MERFFKKLRADLPTSSSIPNEHPQSSSSMGNGQSNLSPIVTPHSTQSSRVVDVNSLESDPALRVKIIDYPSNQRDQVRRAYLQRGPSQPLLIEYPLRDVGGRLRRFSTKWYEKYGSWLEYSEHEDAVFCLYCYLFKNETGFAAGGDAFVSGGFYGWHKKERCDKHVGGVQSSHNLARKKCQDLMNENQSIQVSLCKQDEQTKREYRARLTASIDVLRFLIRQGLPSRGHDESEGSSNKGNFLELLAWYAGRIEDISSVVLKNAPGNNQLISPSIQKDIINACAKETSLAILEELGDEYFSILADESSDVSQKEQLSVCLRYVDRKGKVVERFIGLVHVIDTTALTLKAAIYSLLGEHSLSPSRIRGQGYDGGQGYDDASNMRGEINGLKTLIMKETTCAYYIHCFAHQLQLTLVAVSTKNDDCGWLFETLATLLNLIGGSCKRQEMLRDKQVEQVAQALVDGEIKSGTGLNQELGLRRPGDTRWGSHYKTLLNVVSLFSSICDVLHTLGEICPISSDKIKAQTIAYQLESFHFVFMTHLMLIIFGLTNELNVALQRKDQDLVNAMSLVQLTKNQLQNMRDNGWESLMARVSAFCGKHDIEMLDMMDFYTPWGRSKRAKTKVSNNHHFRVEVFLKVIDQQLQELNHRFDEVNTELLVCMVCLSPNNSFASFDKEKVLRLAEFYPLEFSHLDLIALDFQLEMFISDMRNDDRFSTLTGLGELSTKLVETGKDRVWAYVYLLLKLALTLPVATASVERSFSAMKHVKNNVRNSMGDELLNDCLVVFIERDLASNVSNDAIVHRFQNMKTRRGQL